MIEFGQLENLSDSKSDTENVRPKAKKRRVQCDYVHCRDFPNLAAAKLAIKQERLYTYMLKS